VAVEKKRQDAAGGRRTGVVPLGHPGLDLGGHRVVAESGGLGVLKIYQVWINDGPGKIE
jgi:hypothetical protein